MNNGKICAIVLDYRGAEKTEKCLLSLVGQGIRTAYVLDNSGAESSSKDLSQAIERIRLTDPGFSIAILSAGKNLGFGRGVNFVLRMTAFRVSRLLSVAKQRRARRSRPGRRHDGAVAGDSDVALVAPSPVHDPGREFGIWYHRYFGLLLSDWQMPFSLFYRLLPVIPKRRLPILVRRIVLHVRRRRRTSCG
jgi:hypothetical protein